MTYGDGPYGKRQFLPSQCSASQSPGKQLLQLSPGVEKRKAQVAAHATVSVGVHLPTKVMSVRAVLTNSINTNEGKPQTSAQTPIINQQRILSVNCQMPTWVTRFPHRERKHSKAGNHVTTQTWSYQDAEDLSVCGVGGRRKNPPSHDLQAVLSRCDLTLFCTQHITAQQCGGAMAPVDSGQIHNQVSRAVSHLTHQQENMKVFMDQNGKQKLSTAVYLGD